MKPIFRALFAAGPSIKGWLFADGKFNQSRALILLVAMLLLTLMYYVVGPEGTAFIIDMLDEVSDAIGYE